MFAELFPSFYQNRRHYGDWQAVVISPNRATEQEVVRPYRHLLNSEQIHRIYLNELGEIRQLSIGMALMVLMVLTILQEQDAAEEARYLLGRAEQEMVDLASRQGIMEMITRIMSYKFSQNSLNAMCNLRETLIPQPLLPRREKGGKTSSKSLSPPGRGI